MMNEVPSADALIEAVVRLLNDEMMPQITQPDTRYKALVARNALDIVRRELSSGPAVADAELDALTALCDSPVDCLSTAREMLCAQLRSGQHDDQIGALARTLLPTTARRLAIDNPRFSTLAVIE